MKTKKSRRFAESRPVCVGLKGLRNAGDYRVQFSEEFEEKETSHISFM